MGAAHGEVRVPAGFAGGFRIHHFKRGQLALRADFEGIFRPAAGTVEAGMNERVMLILNLWTALMLTIWVGLVIWDWMRNRR